MSWDFLPFQESSLGKVTGDGERQRSAHSFFVKTWSLATWYLGPGVRTVGNLPRFWGLWLMGCEKETKWGCLELTENDRSQWWKPRVPSAPRMSARLSQWCGRSRNKDMEKADGTWPLSSKWAEHPEEPILLASQSLRWTDGKGVGVLLSRMSMLSTPMRLHLDEHSPLRWKFFAYVPEFRKHTFPLTPGSGVKAAREKKMQWKETWRDGLDIGISGFSVDSSARQVIPVGSNKVILQSYSVATQQELPSLFPWALYIKTADRRVWRSAYLNALH